MRYGSFESLLLGASDDITGNYIADETIDELVRFAFVKASEASSTSLSIPSRIDAVYDALALFAKAAFAASGYYVAFSSKNDEIAFSGLALLLQMPDDVKKKMSLLVGWPLRKYDSGMRILPADSNDALQCLRLVIGIVNGWLKKRQRSVLRPRDRKAGRDL
jgi:hypothetical protein